MNLSRLVSEQPVIAECRWHDFKRLGGRVVIGKNLLNMDEIFMLKEMSESSKKQQPDASSWMQKRQDTCQRPNRIKAETDISAH